MPTVNASAEAARPTMMQFLIGMGAEWRGRRWVEKDELRDLLTGEPLTKGKRCVRLYLPLLVCLSEVPSINTQVLRWGGGGRSRTSLGAEILSMYRNITAALDETKGST